MVRLGNKLLGYAGCRHRAQPLSLPGSHGTSTPPPLAPPPLSLSLSLSLSVRPSSLAFENFFSIASFLTIACHSKRIVSAVLSGKKYTGISKRTTRTSLGTVSVGPFTTAQRRSLCILQNSTMKFLEYTPLVRINAFLSTVNLGDSFLKGNLEAYSCKAAGGDKKHFRNLEQEVIDSLVSSPPSLSVSPLGPLSSSASRKTFIYLVLAMSHVYPDYDFSMLHSTSFEKEDHETAKLKIDDYLREAVKVWASKFGEDSPLCSSIWEAIDEVIGIDDCDVYSYKPDSESDPLTERGTIWSFSYFFYNRRLRRILCFCCQCLSKLAIDDDSLDEMLSEDEADYLESMDMD